MNLELAGNEMAASILSIELPTVPVIVMFNTDPDGVGLQTSTEFPLGQDSAEMICLAVFRRVRTFPRVKVVASSSRRHWRIEGTQHPVIHLKNGKE